MDNREHFSINRNNYNNNGYSSREKKERPCKPKEFFSQVKNFNNDWIIKGVDNDMVEFAEECGKYMAPLDNRDSKALTNSQIRNVYGEIKRIQMKGFNDEKSSFLLLKPKVAYAAGRQNTDGMNLFKEIFDRAYPCVKDKRSFDNFCKLMEAILAYHKFNGGK
ncbi:MAG: type III-A CRISPR-associated protein Csm2 [Bacteroidales bacterium]|jgi:CRISPR-associated protein Csm2|nr:type III-A CRISPR-associated protein Csm2 [Bacteroidales bacterium]